MIHEVSKIENELYFSDLFDACLSSNKLYSATIELTRNCNFSCAHCYNLPETRLPMLSFNELSKLINSLAELNCLYILFTGGEPLIHRDFSRLWEHAYNKGILPTLFTNAFLLNGDHFSLFRKYPPLDIEITMYGFSDETYKLVTGKSNAFGRVKENILMLKKLKIPFSLKSVVLRQNINEIYSIFKFAKELGTTFKYDLNISPAIDGLGKSHLFARPKEIGNLFLKVKDTKKAVQRLLKEAKDFREEFKRAGDLFTCGAGRASIYIDHAGNLHPCVLSRMPIGNILEQPLSALIKHKLPVCLNKKKSTLESYVCRNCPDNYYCDWCPAVEDNRNISKLEIKRWRANICRIARLQKEKFEGKQTNRHTTPTVGHAGHFEHKFKEYLDGK